MKKLMDTDKLWECVREFNMKADLYRELAKDLKDTIIFAEEKIKPEEEEINGRN